jgi:REP element-mobilizing transposase RayT
LASTRNRRSIRLKGWDYGADGAYFVTICTRDRDRLFGTVGDGEMHLNDDGRIVADTWRWLPTRYDVDLDEWCVMPNHLHAILVIRRGGSRTAPTPRTAPTMADRPPSDMGTAPTDTRTAPTMLDTGTVPTTSDPRRPKSIGRAIGAFKTVSTKHINLRRNTPGAVVWQRDFWDRVIRDAQEMDRIREYIRQNAANWNSDALNR